MRSTVAVLAISAVVATIPMVGGTANAAGVAPVINVVAGHFVAAGVEPLTLDVVAVAGLVNVGVGIIGANLFPNGGAAPATATSGCEDLSTCSHATVKEYWNPNASNTYGKIYTVFRHVIPTVGQPDQQADAWYTHASAQRFGGNKLWVLVNDVKAEGTEKVLDWSPNGTTQNGDGTTQSFQLGVTVSGVSVTIGRSWPGYSGKIQGNTPSENGSYASQGWVTGGGGSPDPVDLFSGSFFEGPINQATQFHLTSTAGFSNCC